MTGPDSDTTSATHIIFILPQFLFGKVIFDEICSEIDFRLNFYGFGCLDCL